MQVAAVTRLKRCANRLMRFCFGETRGVAFLQKKAKCPGELRPPPPKDTFQTHMKMKRAQFVLLWGKRGEDRGTAIWTDRQGEIGN